MFKPAYGTDGTNDLWADTGKNAWFNEPEQWEIKNNVLSMSVTPQSDYWVFLTTVLQ